MRKNGPTSRILARHITRAGMQPFLETTRTVVALVDTGGTGRAGNPAFHTLNEAAGSPASIIDLAPENTRPAFRALLDTASRAPGSVRGRLELGLADEASVYDCIIVNLGRGRMVLFAEPIQLEADMLSAYDQAVIELGEARSALADKTAELHAVLAQADELAHTDSLTFLPNRRSIIANLQRHVTYAERYRTPLAISMMDLDGFKAVNDSSGHRVGDEILTIIARELRDRIRQPDEIGRYGGDEFLVILPNATAVGASEQAARLCQHVRSAAVSSDDRSIRLTLSAGIAQFAAGVDTWQTLLDRADRALYEAKRLGGDQWLILEA